MSDVDNPKTQAVNHAPGTPPLVGSSVVSPTIKANAGVAPKTKATAATHPKNSEIGRTDSA